MRKLTLSVVVAGLVFANTIDSSNGNFFVIKENGSLYSWGDSNYYGDLGTGDTGYKKIPTKIDDKNINSEIIDIGVGGDHSLVLTKDGKVYSWGHNGHGQLGIGNTDNQSTPIEVNTTNISSSITQISAGDYHSLALAKDGKLYGWGYNGYGQLGIGNTDTQYNPVEVNTTNITSDIVQISAGAYHILALTKDGKLYAWGYNEDGELGIGNTDDKYIPTEVNTTNISSKIIKVVGAGYHSILLTENGEVWTTGHNDYGQLGTGDTNNRTKFTKIKLDKKIINIEGGYRNTILTAEDGFIYRMGDGYNDYHIPTKAPINIYPFKEVINNKKLIKKYNLK